MKKAIKTAAVILPLCIAVVLAACNVSDEPGYITTRYEAIPAESVKITPQADLFPPVIHSDEWMVPVPMPGPINTAGAEDSPFITPDGQTFYFWFTPDVDIPPNQQLFDGVTGIWRSIKIGSSWSEPERIVLCRNECLDGCIFVQEDTMWFCSARAGNYREIDFWIAGLDEDEWTNWRNAGRQLNEDYQIGEMHITSDGNTMYFHGEGTGSYGAYDIWKTERTDSGWSEPVNLGPVINSEQYEGWPFVSSDGKELWFTSPSRLGYPGPAIYRSLKQPDDEWGAPVEIISSFAGEPTLDDEGNIYFTHHFFSQDMRMIEADIYVAYRK